MAPNLLKIQVQFIKKIVQGFRIRTQFLRNSLCLIHFGFLCLNEQKFKKKKYFGTQKTIRLPLRLSSGLALLPRSSATPTFIDTFDSLSVLFVSLFYHFMF